MQLRFEKGPGGIVTFGFFLLSVLPFKRKERLQKKMQEMNKVDKSIKPNIGKARTKRLIH
jgi:hypothetical protein